MLWYICLGLILLLLSVLIVFTFIMIFICILDDTKFGQIIHKKLKKLLIGE